MKGLGQRLRLRAKELGLADATVAERVGLSQQRYHNYISDQTEPDFETFVRICRALVVEPNAVLGFTEREAEPDESSILRDRILATTTMMTPQALRISAAVLDTLALETEPASKLSAESTQPTTPKPVRSRIRSLTSTAPSTRRR